MKSTKTDKKPFSFEDFEEGLMLAGHISPRSLQELADKEALDLHEANSKTDAKKGNKTIFFKRVVLAAEIANNLHNEPTFGHVKFQKIVYLSEHIAEMDLNHRYSKQAAGPFDNKFMHSIDTQFKRNKWFVVEKVEVNNITRFKYSPSENRDNYKKYYDSYFSNKKNQISELIEIFRKKKTDSVEITATIFACLIELKAKQSFTKEDLLELFYNWSPKKKRFSEKEVISNWEWMNEIGLIPK
jgi:hypothetical protein